MIDWEDVARERAATIIEERARAVAAEAEVQRLREALIRIRDGARSNPYHEIANVARSALAKETT